ncbi:hypothetical protein MRX96_005651 [Rhipicephalus microplus]
MAYQVVAHYNYNKVGNEYDDEDARASLSSAARASCMPWDFKREPESSRADANKNARCYVPVIDFEGTWKYPLDAKALGQGFFYESPCDPNTVDTIRQTGRFRVFDATKNLGAMVVEVPYQGPKDTFSLHTKVCMTELPEIALVLFIPTVMDGQEELERRLNLMNVIDLKETLSSLSFETWYTDQLPPLQDSGPHAVSAAIHASAFRVCTKSGAAQAMKTTSSKGRAAAGCRHSVDRPFFFMVTSSDPDVMLLLGSVKSIDW